MGQRPIRSSPSVRMKYASRQAACLKQRKAQQHRIPHARPNRRGYVALHRNAAHQYGINRHADDDEKRLKPQRKKTPQVVLPHLPPFAVRHRCHWNGCNRCHQINLDHAPVGDDENADCQRPHREADKHALHPQSEQRTQLHLRQLRFKPDDNAVDADIRTTLLQEGASQCDLIFGPLYTKQVAPLSEFCKNNGIKLVIPFSISGDDVERSKEIFQIYQSQESLNDATVKVFLKRFTNVHPIFVDCNDSTSRKGAFTFGLRKELEKRNINFSITNVNSSIEQFAKAFVPSKQNVVILNTGRSPQLTAVLNKLDEFDAKYPGASISLFGYTEWLMYAKYNLERFYKYDTYIPSTFYYNASNVRTQSLETSYQRWFHQPMQVALPRFAITGYDHAMFFIQGVKKEGRNFTGDSKHSTYQPVQTPLDFEKSGLKGGYKNKSFMLIHYTFNHQIEAVKY